MIMDLILILFTILSLFGILVGFQFYVSVFLFYKGQKKNRNQINKNIETFYKKFDTTDFPFVTIQLPVYNEANVIKRLMLSAVEVDYPKDKLEIQLVDDSADETVKIIDQYITILKHKYNINIYSVRRKNREGFKAGALSNALKFAKGEYVAIFDADFIIPEKFLKRTIPQIHDYPEVACIQTRWGHINRYESWLTKGVSVALDALIAFTQAAKSYSNTCPTFCGTAGILRVDAINKSGGWSSDTLTEDQCLSFRMHAAGYKIILDFDQICNAEIPNNIIAFKSQQRRWVKGGVQTLIKLLPTIFVSKHLTVSQKFASFCHMATNLTTVLPVFGSILLLPLLISGHSSNSNYNNILTVLWTLVFITGTFGPLVIYIGSGYAQKITFFSFRYIPTAMLLFAGTSVSSSLGGIEAICGIKSAFIRTPKSGSSAQSSKKKNKYKPNSSIISGLIELIIALICISNLLLVLSCTSYSKYFFACFLTIYALGVCMFAFTTLKCAYISMNKQQK
ncbi:MAG TPA: glycosyltransferase [Victivallales bacterium]|nr:glycosyltransferase [Victivallales bacterium]